MSNSYIIEQNKILAAFLDGEVDFIYRGADKIGRFEQLAWEGKTAVKYRRELMKMSIGDAILVEQLQFHESYDWIMPVWNKFKALETEGVAWVEFMNLKDALKSTLAERDISDFHQTLVSAIQWYRKLNIVAPKLYHITKENNIESIQEQGLIPGYRAGITVKVARDRRGKFMDVFLTNDVDRILKTQAGEAWCKRWKPVVFEVDLAGMKVEPKQYRYGATYTISDFEFLVRSKISPQRIKLIGNVNYNN